MVILRNYSSNLWVRYSITWALLSATRSHGRMGKLRLAILLGNNRGEKATISFWVCLKMEQHCQDGGDDAFPHNYITGFQLFYLFGGCYSACGLSIVKPPNIYREVRTLFTWHFTFFCFEWLLLHIIWRKFWTHPLVVLASATLP